MDDMQAHKLDKFTRSVNMEVGEHINKIVEAAKANDIPLLVTCYTLFEACGRLYEMGIKGCPHKVFADE